MPARLKTGPQHLAQTRITAGGWRGRVVSTPSGREVRPTRAMVRQSGYDILGQRIVGADVRRWLRGASEQTEAADLCYVDAPYQDPELESVLELLGAAPPRLVVCEHHRAREISEQIGSLTRFREARYGLTTISFLQRSAAPTDGTA